jgi:hypothetical protein
MKTISFQDFSLFPETPPPLPTRPFFTSAQEGVMALPGSGNYTGWKFADLMWPRWKLSVDFRVPAAAKYCNSGIFILHRDPFAGTENLTAAEKAGVVKALGLAQASREQHGPGPFELDFFAHEVQLVFGEGPEIPRNQKTAALYRVPEGAGTGEQRLGAPPDLVAGESYQLQVKYQDRGITTEIRGGAGGAWSLISTMRLPTPEQDFARSAEPLALYLQAYYNDGVEVSSFVFEEILLEAL